jgi:aldehyde dehydrogenase (NAD+)
MRAVSRAFSTKPLKLADKKLLINGKFVPSVTGKTFDTYCPATEDRICSVADASVEDVNLAVKAARTAFDEGPWRRMSAFERGNCLFRLADLMEKHQDELAALEALDNGKPFTFAKAADIALCIKTYRYYGGWADKIHGQTIPISGNYFCYTRKEPVGVAAQVIPW